MNRRSLITRIPAALLLAILPGRLTRRAEAQDVVYGGWIPNAYYDPANPPYAGRIDIDVILDGRPIGTVGNRYDGQWWAATVADESGMAAGMTGIETFDGALGWLLSAPNTGELSA